MVGSPLLHPAPIQKGLLHEGFGQGLQVEATRFKKPQESEFAK